MRQSKLNEVLALRSMNKINNVPTACPEVQSKPCKSSNKNPHNPLIQQLGAVLTCPHCDSKVYVKNGKNNNTQRYLCKSCHRSFIELTNTVIYCTKKDVATWTQFLNCLIKQFPLRRCAKELNISLNTAFYWRHKILDALREHSKTTELSGTITVHDTYLRRSFKGNHTNNDFLIPRKPRIRGNTMSYESISEEHVCILSAIDSKNNLLMEPVCLSHLRNPDVIRVLVPIIKPSSRLITDILWAYKSMCLRFNFKHTRVSNYTINVINNLHKVLKVFLSVYKGVATKYLSNYLTLFKYIKNNKICKFTKNVHTFDAFINYPLANELILLLRGDFPYINSSFCGRRTVFT